MVGSYRGLQVVQQIDPMALLAEMLEELSFAASEHEEKNIQERKPVREEKGQFSGRTSRFAVGKLKDLNKQDLDQFLQSLRQKNIEKQGEVRPLIAALFKSPLHQHAALQYAREEYGENPALLAALDSLATELEEAYGPEIRAGYNIASVPAEGLAGGQAELRALYADTVLDCKSLEEAMHKLVDRYGADNFSTAVSNLFKAVSADCSAAAPSLAPARLQTLMDDMYQLEVLGNTYRDCAALLDKVRSEHPPCPGAALATAKAEDIMRPVFRLKDDHLVQPSQVATLMPFLQGSPDPVCDVHISQGVKDIVRKMPHRVFSDNDKRQALLNAVQQLVDAAVEREEAQEA
jgi:type III secretion protein W